MPPDLSLLSTLLGSNYPSLELIFMVPKVFEPLKFDCICFFYALVMARPLSYFIEICFQHNIDFCNQTGNYFSAINFKSSFLYCFPCIIIVIIYGKQAHCDSYSVRLWFEPNRRQKAFFLLLFLHYVLRSPALKEIT